MGKTFKDKPKGKPQDLPKRKPKEGRRFEPTKGRQNPNLKDLIRDGRDLEDYFI